MPIIAAFFRFFGAVAFSLLGKVLISAGIGVVTYVGVSHVLDDLKALVIEQFGNVPSDLLAILHAASVDKAVTIILSAYAIKLTLRGVTAAGKLSAFSVTPPA